MSTSKTNTQARIFDSLPERVQIAISAYASAVDLSTDAVIQFAIAHFLELEDSSSDTRPNHPTTDNILDDLPAVLQREIKRHGVEQEMPPEFVVELAVAHFLDPDSVTFDDCQVGLQRDRVELLRQQKRARQVAAA